MNTKEKNLLIVIDVISTCPAFKKNLVFSYFKLIILIFKIIV